LNSPVGFQHPFAGQPGHGVRPAIGLSDCVFDRTHDPLPVPFNERECPANVLGLERTAAEGFAGNHRTEFCCLCATEQPIQTLGRSGPKYGRQSVNRGPDAGRRGQGRCDVVEQRGTGRELVGGNVECHA
jgi:hypothetical protein